jgi:hypothetical protein
MLHHAKIKRAMFLLAVAASFDAAAYSNDKPEEPCRDPKIQEFNLPEYKAGQTKEVPAEADFSFVVSGWADPKKIKVTGKDKPIPFVVESADTFHRVKGKIPAEFTGKYVRLNVRIPAVLGCYSTQGWLLKVADQAAATPSAAPAEQAPQATEASPTPAEKTVTPAATVPSDKPAEAITPPAGDNAKPTETAPTPEPAK